MEKWISPMEKRNFLKWFLETHHLKHTDARKVLEYMIHRYPFLENLFFTEAIMPARKTMVVSSMNSEEPGFIFYYRQHKTGDVSEALESIIMNPSEKIYLVIHFTGKMFNQRYIQLIETPAIQNIKRYGQQLTDAKETVKLLGKVKAEKEIELLKKQIDQALDQRDKGLFTVLAAKLNRLIQGAET